MKNVYFVLANKTYGNALYLPYAAACLAAQAWSLAEIRNAYRFGGIIYKRDPIDLALRSLREPAVVAFTCYMWTIEYNRLLAAAIKEAYPECVVIFGGHDISPDRVRAGAYPQADIFIYGEGESTFCEVLRALENGEPLSGIDNLAYRENGVLRETARSAPGEPAYVSPYLEGYFDEMLAASPGTEFCATVETNRGCPYQCAYCDWCDTAAIRRFPLEKVFAEIEWCGKHKIEYVYCADGNFGILERDLEIAACVVKTREKYGYPKVFNPCFAKNSNDHVFEISRLLYEHKLIKAVTLAYQTVCDTVLKNINRKNFSLDAFSALQRRYVACGIPTYTELILGLPGETYDSFCDGLCSLIEAGQQNAMTVYGCQVFANALLGKAEYMKTFGVKTAHVLQSCIHVSPPESDEIREYTDLVIATAAMPFEDMIRALMFCTCVQGFHHIGLLRFVAVYLRRTLDVSYRSFYERLLRFILSRDGTFLQSFFLRMRRECEDLSNGEWTYFNDRFGNVGWYYEEGLFMEAAANLDVFWQELAPFLAAFPADREIMDELCRYQKFLIRLPGQTEVHGVFDYDFYSYFKTSAKTPEQPAKRRTELRVRVAQPVETWQEYGRKIMLFAKKKGATLLVNAIDDLTLRYEDTEA